MNDPRQSLHIRVESVPSGAAVYGISGNSAGTYCGTTPFTFKYIKRPYYPIWGTLVSETLVDESKGNALQNTYFRAFQCFVIKDGYRPYTVYKVLENQKASGWLMPFGETGDVKDRDLNTGSMTITAMLEPLQTEEPPSRPSPAPQQQQQQQQSVIIQDPGAQSGKLLLSCNVDGAEIFVDGVFVGNTPATLKLKDGIHIIEVKKPGYGLYRKEIRILADSELSLRVELSRSN